jgi:uncharacterized protein YndB with AHSA1/START domain
MHADIWTLDFKEHVMANPLKMLKLKPVGFQFIQEVPIAARPKEVWKTLLDVGKWSYFHSESQMKNTLEAWPGGRWMWEGPGVQALFATVTQVEPEKLLRLQGTMGMNHIPVTSAVIFELQPTKDGKETLLRVGQRTYGYMTADVKKGFGKGWKQLLGQLKEAVEK